MNFLSHAWLAHADRPEPRFVLGAMLPDFASMCGAHLHGTGDPLVAAGLAHHQEVDERFHVQPEFTALCRDVGAWLRDAGVGRGPAMAVAHVGVEILVDATLIGDVDAAYLAAIATAPVLDWSDAGAAWGGLRGRLRDHGMPTMYRDDERVAQLMVRILEGRPRLRLDVEHVPAVAECLAAFRGRVELAAPILLRAASPAPS